MGEDAAWQIGENEHRPPIFLKDDGCGTDAAEPIAALNVR